MSSHRQLRSVGVESIDTAPPIAVGPEWKLMVDDYLIDRFEGGAELRLHHPTERAVVFTCDRPWEGDWSGMCTFIQDGDSYRMYYTGGSWSRGRDSVCCAESADGIHWTRPELGLVERDGSTRNNVILPGTGISAFVPFLDASPTVAEAERYKALAAMGEPVAGLYGFASPDGVHWHKIRDEPLITRGKFDSQNVAFWDVTRDRYVAYYREMRGLNDEIRPEGPQLGLDDDGPARDVMTCTSSNFLDWTEPRWLRYPDAPREQISLNQVRPYYRNPHLFVGFPARFMAAREIQPNLPITEHPSYSHGAMVDHPLHDQPRRTPLQTLGRGLHPPRTPQAALDLRG